jgi:hypothetical protein
MSKKVMIGIAIVCCAIMFAAATITTRRQNAEHFGSDRTIIIIPNGSSVAQPNGSMLTTNIIFNQGKPLNLPFEFVIANPFLSVEQLKDIVNEVLPGSSSENFVVMK